MWPPTPSLTALGFVVLCAEFCLQQNQQCCLWSRNFVLAMTRFNGVTTAAMPPFLPLVLSIVTSQVTAIVTLGECKCRPNAVKLGCTRRLLLSLVIYETCTPCPSKTVSTILKLEEKNAPKDRVSGLTRFLMKAGLSQHTSSVLRSPSIWFPHKSIPGHKRASCFLRVWGKKPPGVRTRYIILCGCKLGCGQEQRWDGLTTLELTMAQCRCPILTHQSSKKGSQLWTSQRNRWRSKWIDQTASIMQNGPK